MSGLVPQPLGSVPQVKGDPGAVEQFATILLSVSSDVDDLATTTTSVSTVEGWSGDAAES